MVPPYRRPDGAPRGGRAIGFPWLVKAMFAVMVIAAFIVLILVWSRSGAPSQMRAGGADGAGPRVQDGVATLNE